jgi:hypothetical protein
LEVGNMMQEHDGGTITAGRRRGMQEKDLENLRKISADMDAKATRVRDHMGARRSMTAAERRDADLAFMDVLAEGGSFWDLVHRTLVYARDTAEWAAKMFEDPVLRPRNR